MLDVLPENTPKNKDIQFNERESDHQFPSRMIPVDGNIRSEKQEDVEHIPPEEILDEDNIPPHEQIGASGLLPRMMPNDDIMPPAKLEGVEHNLSICYILYSEISLFEKAGNIRVFNKRNEKIFI